MDRDQKISLLKTIPLLSEAGPVLLARLADKVSAAGFKAGKIIMADGSDCNNLIMVAAGRVEVYRRVSDDFEVISGVLPPGSVLGEYCILEGSRSGPGLRTLEDTVLLFLDRVSVLSFIKDSPEFARCYLRFLAGKGRAYHLKEAALLNHIIALGMPAPDDYAIRRPQCAPGIGSGSHDPGAADCPPAPDESLEGQDNFFFTKEYSCPICSTVFQTPKPRRKHVVIINTDEDFCNYYKTVNPLFYEINACPNCGYSFNSSTYGPALKQDAVKKISRVLSENWQNQNYCGSRNLDDAIQTFRLALICQRERGADYSAVGLLCLKLGWLHRYKNDKASEREYLTLAVEHLTNSFVSTAEMEPREEINLMFLLGQLNLILDNDRGALDWFVRITQHPEGKSYPYMLNKARNMWQILKQRFKDKNGRAL